MRTTSQATGPHDTTPRPSRPSAPGVFLTERQLAERWQVNPGSLANARGRGRSLVPFVRIMGRIRYPLATIEQFEACLVDQAAA
jgi:hypothetical protein